MKKKLIILSIIISIFSCKDAYLQKEKSPQEISLPSDSLVLPPSPDSLITEIDDWNRYFLINYKFARVDHSGDGEGSMWFITNSEFPSKKFIDSIAYSGLEYVKSCYQGVVITSIFEFKNKSDYQNFSKGQSISKPLKQKRCD